MILQALYEHYNDLARRDANFPRYGWEEAKVSFALSIDADGTLQGVRPLKYRPEGAKKDVPQTMLVPARQKKTSGVAANFLCENTSYFLGVDDKGKPDRAARCFAAAKALHQEILTAVDTLDARAVYAFFENWDLADAASHPAIAPYLAEMMQGANLVFSVEDSPYLYAHEDPAIRDAWMADRNAKVADTDEAVCLITGRTAPAARLHPSVRGVRDAQSSGASLVSFNAAAFESYGHTQGENAPVSEEAAFAYGTALNHLISDRAHVQYIGDTAVLSWAESAEPAYQDIFLDLLMGTPSEAVREEDLRDAVKKLCAGRPIFVGAVPLHPENQYYVLGIAPNAARLSVRFFWQSSFGKLLQNVEAHNTRLEITGPPNRAPLTLWRMLDETVNQKSRDKKPVPPMAGAVLRAILSGGAYPAELFEQTMLRIRAEREITPGRAAILKAFFLNNREFKIPEEVLTVQLNEQSDYLPYILGRLFAVLERVQEAANSGINTTIKDKYFNSASATPASIFPLLTKLSQSHLKKLEGGQKVYFEKQIGELECRIREMLPARLTLAEQGAFHLGYYHQRQFYFTKKTEEETKND